MLKIAPKFKVETLITFELSFISREIQICCDIHVIELQDTLTQQLKYMICVMPIISSLPTGMQWVKTLKWLIKSSLTPKGETSIGGANNKWHPVYLKRLYWVCSHLPRGRKWSPCYRCCLSEVRMVRQLRANMHRRWFKQTEIEQWILQAYITFHTKHCRVCSIFFSIGMKEMCL